MRSAHLIPLEEPREALVTLLGADFQSIVAPFKVELAETARVLQGDRHKAALHLLAQRQALRRPRFEQQLILAALVELDEAGGGGDATT